MVTTSDLPMHLVFPAGGNRGNALAFAILGRAMALLSHVPLATIAWQSRLMALHARLQGTANRLLASQDELVAWQALPAIDSRGISTVVLLSRQLTQCDAGLKILDAIKADTDVLAEISAETRELLGIGLYAFPAVWLPLRQVDRYTAVAAVEIVRIREQLLAIREDVRIDRANAIKAARAAFDPKASLDRIFSENKVLFAALAAS